MKNGIPTMRMYSRFCAPFSRQSAPFFFVVLYDFLVALYDSSKDFLSRTTTHRPEALLQPPKHAGEAAAFECSLQDEAWHGLASAAGSHTFLLNIADKLKNHAMGTIKWVVIDM